MRILLVEDDAAIVSALSSLLRSEGYDVASCAGQNEALALAEQGCDLALLDVSLAQGNGFATCAGLRAANPELPVIFLTASDDECSTVTGLDLGAVDYVAKPFRPRELLARVKAALRQARPPAHVLTCGPLRLDPASARVSRDGREVFLSPIEYRLLLALMGAEGRLVTRQALAEALWESGGSYLSDNSLNVYLRRLREKVEKDPSHPKLIVTVRGLGYRMGS